MENQENIESAFQQAVEFGVFGEETQYLSFNQSSSSDKTDVDLSEDIPGTLILKTKDSESSHSLIIKTLNESNPYPFKHLAFLGEISVHRRILPQLEQFVTHSILPFFSNFFYGSISSQNATDIAFIVTENLEQYQPSQWDFRHLSLTMKALAALHAASYLAKSKDPDQFFPQLRRIYELNFAEKASPQSKLLDLFLEHSNVKEFFKTVLTKQEPSSVICLGVFNPRKIVFKTDSQGNPISVKFTDLFGARYTSPAFDLMNVLYLCIGKDIRDKYWQDALKVYNESLGDALLKAEDDAYVPKFSDIEQDFKKYSFMSYLIGAAVLPSYNNKNSSQILNEIEESIISRYFNSI